MRILLDTHVFLWYISGDRRLPNAFKCAIENPANETLLSSASVWESVVKSAIGKLQLPYPPAEYLPRQRHAHGIMPLPIDEHAMTFLASLPHFHRDPFDRILIAQAIQQSLTIATVDAAISAYPVPLLPTS